MKLSQLKQLIKEEISKVLKETKEDKYLTMVSLFTDKNGKWHNEDWSFDPSFESQGLVAKYGKGANGVGMGKPVILCADYNENDISGGFHDEWKWVVVFKKNINEIYLDDEVFDFGKYPSKDIEKQAIYFIQKIWKKIKIFH